MNNDDGRANPGGARKGEVAPTVRWLVRYCIRRSRQHRAEKKKETAQDRAGRRTAAATIAIAIFTFVLAGLGMYQGTITARQLDEMRNQRLATQAQIRADMRQEAFSIDAAVLNGGQRGWMFVPQWRNAGSTDAQQAHGIWALELATKNKPPATPALCPPLPPPEEPAGIVPPGGTLLQGGQFLPLDVAKSAGASEIVIIVAGHMEWRDIFPDTPMHYRDWCDWLFPNDITRNAFSFIALKHVGD